MTQQYLVELLCAAQVLKVLDLAVRQVLRVLQHDDVFALELIAREQVLIVQPLDVSPRSLDRLL